MRYERSIWHSLVLLTVIILSASARCAAQGGVPIRIPDAGSRCINGSTDRIWLTLRRVITEKTKGWLTQDKKVAIVINVQVKSPDASKPMAFPLMTEAKVSAYAAGQVSIPIEYTIIDGFRLKQDKITYSGSSVEMTLLNKKGKTKWGRALETLAQVTKKLPIPASPYTQAATYLMDFANDTINKEIEDQNKDDKSVTGAIALNIDPLGKCEAKAQDGSDFEGTGTVAILQSSGVQGSGYVDIRKTNEYCWIAEKRPAFVLKAAPKDSTKPCEAMDKSAFKQVTNDYIGYFLNAEAVPSGGGVGILSVRNDRQASIARCKEHGLNEARCFPPASKKP